MPEKIYYESWVIANEDGAILEDMDDFGHTSIQTYPSRKEAEHMIEHSALKNKGYVARQIKVI